MKTKNIIVSVITLAILAGCGGGGGSTTPTNTPPTANAGVDVSTIINSPITLVGSGSDSDGTITSYKWKEGSTTIGSSASISYTPTSLGLHTLTLTVTDNDGATATDTVVINVINPSTIQKLLVVRINFSNYTFNSNASTWASKIFGTASGELNNYYSEISKGNFQFAPATESDGASDGIVTTTINTTHPGNDDPANGDFHLWNTFKTALNQIDSKVDFSIFDTNNDGAISRDELQIIFLVAGGESSTGWPLGSSVWGMKSCYEAPTTPTAPTLDGKVLMKCSTQGDFARFGERHFFNNPADATIGIIAHELGHSTFGLIDLYDTDGDSGGIGDFGLMSSGSWGAKAGERPGATPVHMSAWSKIKAGFITPTVLTNTTAVTKILNGSSLPTYNVYRVNTSNASEYFLVENRAPAGYDLGLKNLAGLGSNPFTGGIAVWHIDEAQVDNSNQNRKLVDLVEANNAELDNSTGHNTGHINNLFFASNLDTLTSSKTQTYNNISTGFEMTNISTSSTVMSADIKAQ